MKIGWFGAFAAGAFLGSVAATNAGTDASLPPNPDFDYAAPAPGSYQLPVVKAATDGALVDAGGASLNLREITGGRITVLSFIYTRCGDARACPYAASVLNHLRRASVEDKALAKNLRLVSLSFDPEHDTPARLADYAAVVRDDERGCEWRFVTPKSVADLPAILRGYGQVVDRKQNAADGLGPLYHTLRVFLIDRDRRIRNIYSSGTLDPRLVLADVKTLLLEETQNTRGR